MIRGAIRLGLGPVLLWQGRAVRQNVLRLPEPDGARSGRTGNGKPLSLLVIGDSAAAGVGVETQGDALTGLLVARLADRRAIDWCLFARTGWTTGETLEALGGLTGTYDTAVVSLGVNDVTTETPIPRYLSNYAELVGRLGSDHGVRRVIASAVPPMGSFPAMPQPLRWYMGMQSSAYDRALAHWASGQEAVDHLPFDAGIGTSDMAVDGFHPGRPIYERWAAQAAEALVEGA